MAFIRALRELELFHFLQRSTECRRCLLVLACDSGVLKVERGKSRDPTGIGEPERGEGGG